MTPSSLADKTIAVIATDGFEESELKDPVRALEEVGAKCEIVAPKKGQIKGWNHDHWTSPIPVDKVLGEVSAKDYDGLLIPGGTLNADKIRMERKAVELVREFFNESKPVAVICHGPELLIEADVVEGRKLTSYKSIKTDLENAGAEWIDKEVVVDNGLVTSRDPNDLPAFITKMIEEFAEGEHSKQSSRMS